MSLNVHFSNWQRLQIIAQFRPSTQRIAELGHSNIFSDTSYSMPRSNLLFDDTPLKRSLMKLCNLPDSPAKYLLVPGDKCMEGDLAPH